MPWPAERGGQKERQALLTSVLAVSLKTQNLEIP